MWKQIIQKLEDQNLDPTLVSDQIRNYLRKALKDDSEFDTEDLKGLFKIIAEGTGDLRGAQKEYVEQINKFRDNMFTLNKAVIDATNKFAEAQAKVVDVQERGFNRLEEFTGKKRSASERERSRREAANLRLGSARTGFGARAGDVGATARAAAKAFTTMQAERKKATAASEAGQDPTGFTKAAQEASNAYNRATTELDRMTDQSARASDAMERQGDLIASLEKLKAAFDQTKSFLQDFAFGDVESREATVKAFRDLQLAMGQGSMRGATGEQRGRIGGLLDQLSDVRFATGETVPK